MTKLKTSKALEELQRRELVRSSMAELSKLCGLPPASHHLYLMRHLEQVTRGELSRLLVSAPPGSAKSSVVSVMFPAFFLANHPHAQIILISHTAELAERFGRRVRNLIIEHGKVLGIELADDSQAAGRWNLKNSSGSFLAMGAQGSLAGNRADVLAFDDVYRSREDAQSDLVRQRISEWFASEALVRLRPGGRVVGIGTRFHHQDLLAELEATGGYKVIKLNALSEEGDELGRLPQTYLWSDQPETYPYSEFLKQQHRDQPSVIWESLFQNRPTPLEGAFFQASWFKTYDRPPSRDQMHVYLAVDFAVTNKATADYTALGVFGIDPSGETYLLDMWRKQCDAATSVSKLIDLCALWKPLVVVTEAGTIKNSLEPFIKEQMIARNQYAVLETFAAKHDKVTRAQSIQGRMAMCGLFIPARSEWVEAFKKECLEFPHSAFDDQVDVLSAFGMLLSRLVPGSAPRLKEEQKRLVIGGPGTNICMEDLWREEERRVSKFRSSGRIK
jgi:predicted phage terminase large subunit-like protein